MIVSQVNFTSSAVTGSPSCQVTPGRSLKVMVLPSLETPPFSRVGTSVARSPTGLASSSRKSSPRSTSREPLTTLPVSAVISVLSVGMGCHIPIVIVFSPWEEAVSADRAPTLVGVPLDACHPSRPRPAPTPPRTSVRRESPSIDAIALSSRAVSFIVVPPCTFDRIASYPDVLPPPAPTPSPPAWEIAVLS